MTPFLKLVADDLRLKMNNDLSRVAIIFPNKRASLFMNEYLTTPSTNKDTAPIWSPIYMTISDFFRSLSSFRVADPIETICRLYQHYVALTHSQETLDFFYGWGERLLADFDDVDKNMADAQRLFRNLREIKELDSIETLNESQEKVLQDFFQDFSLKENSRIRTKFLELWNVMHPLYTALNESLAADKLAYEGALYRQVTTGLTENSISLPNHITHYAFVGFNVLNKVEETLFAHLQQQGKALFYWDYDVYYTDSENELEAGTFLKRNMERFPGELPTEVFNNFLARKDIEFVAAPTENAGARAVAPWLQKHLTADAKRTAIVLCNEKILLPVLHSLPPIVKETNVTKGFPLHHTAAFTLINSLLPKEDTETDIKKWLEKAQKTVKEAAMTIPDSENSFNGTLMAEAYFQTFTILNRFTRLADSGLLNITVTTLSRLVRQVMRQTAIPFHGEPVVGLQIMGMLETRVLDFENILMLSVNEGYLPEKNTENSFIPYKLRCEFGLTTSLHKTAVYAYYFYRLLQRASHVRLIYNNSTDNRGTGEMSRFMTQILIESGLPIRSVVLSAKPYIAPATSTVIEKPADLSQKITAISPSAINTYLRCPLQFYYRYVAKLRREQPATAALAPNTFGTIFHKAAELLYKEKLTSRNGLITADMLTPLLEKDGNVTLLEYVRRAFAEEGETPDVVVEEVVKSYLKNLLRHDMHITPFEVKATEMPTEMPITVSHCGKPLTITLRGNIDRLDIVNIEGLTHLRIVDYKTGGKPEEAADMEQLFTPSEKHPHYILQTFLYALTMTGKTKHPIAPSLFFVNQAADKSYSPYLKLAKEDMLNFQTIAEDFKEHLEKLIAEILDPAQPFTATPTIKFCETCDFYALCKK